MKKFEEFVAMILDKLMELLDGQKAILNRIDGNGAEQSEDTEEPTTSVTEAGQRAQRSRGRTQRQRRKARNARNKAEKARRAAEQSGADLETEEAAITEEEEVLPQVQARVDQMQVQAEEDTASAEEAETEAVTEEQEQARLEVEQQALEDAYTMVVDGVTSVTEWFSQIGVGGNMEPIDDLNHIVIEGVPEEDAHTLEEVCIQTPGVEAVSSPSSTGGIHVEINIQTGFSLFGDVLQAQGEGNTVRKTEETLVVPPPVIEEEPEEEVILPEEDVIIEEDLEEEITEEEEVITPPIVKHDVEVVSEEGLTDEDDGAEEFDPFA